MSAVNQIFCQWSTLCPSLCAPCPSRYVCSAVCPYSLRQPGDHVVRSPGEIDSRWAHTCVIKCLMGYRQRREDVAEIRTLAIFSTLAASPQRGRWLSSRTIETNRFIKALLGCIFEDGINFNTRFCYSNVGFFFNFLTHATITNITIHTKSSTTQTSG